MDVFSTQKEISNENILYFEKNGFLIFRDLICPEELGELREEANIMIASMDKNLPEDNWYNDDIPSEWYKSEYHGTMQNEKPVQRGIPFRIEYPIQKSLACQRLMGHPVILNAIQKLLKTPNFIPTWDSFVFKQEGKGVPIKWHRDASASSVDNTPAIDVGFYLDDANVDLQNCLWVIPGSNKWDDNFAAHMIQFLSSDGFKKSGAIPVIVKPGDVIFHNILVVHGSTHSEGPLRRTVYYEYRAIEQELKMGPHIPEYIPLKQKLLDECLKKRKEKNYGHDEEFIYQPTQEYQFDKETPLDTFRFPHKIYFRKDYKG